MSQFPLGLPEGSVRALISLAVVLFAGGLTVFLIVDDAGADIAKVMGGGMIASLATVITAYFGSRQSG